MFLNDGNPKYYMIWGIIQWKTKFNTFFEHILNSPKIDVWAMVTLILGLANTTNNLLIDLVHQRNTEMEKAAHVELFTDLIRSIERCQTELLEMVDEQQKAAGKQEEELIEKLEQEISELKLKSTELEQVSNTEDHLHLLKVSQHLSDQWQCSMTHKNEGFLLSPAVDLLVPVQP